MRRLASMTMVGVVALLAAFVVADGGMAAGPSSNAPRLGVSHSQSLNWSGYAAFQSGTTFTDARGSWTQPKATCSSGNQYASFWVGLDGYNSSTVEQIGTDSDCSGSKAVYYAWYEMYPAFPVQLPLTIKPGDTITAEVSYSGSTFVLTLTDGKQSYKTPPLKLKRAARSSAEWVAEAPSGQGGVLPLANFGTVNFSGSYATANNVTGSISSSAWQNDPMTMVTKSGQFKAVSTALSAGGTAFSVQWVHQ